MLVTEDKSHVVVAIDNGCSHRSSAAGEGCSDAGDRSDEEQRSSHDSGNEIVGVCEKERGSSASECSVEVDLEEGAVPEVKVHLDNVERDCRICHLSMDMTNHESGTPIELGCSCKDDLAAAHKQCAEAWFKIKGNKTCEICGSIARNVAGAIEIQMTEQWNEGNEGPMVAASGPVAQAETRNFWQGHRFLNFLLACMLTI
ncbi:hypothetical protein CR513_21399 [Mucuna pruriens]|uniref:RING-CH-type domain-containing protein n=1 Tax=Mucuna pruriens TaxID=157652 RepID=A0A371GZY1_MUCPR|nr:hypothetical protein CR513_21399 [Mucuna pruriens]